jgi:CRISPR system Cascade subunit CasC
MVADRTELNVDAAVQVSHAISTHGTSIEFDYFTALDDAKDFNEQGAAMLGTIEFSSATYYRYATVALHQLAENLADDIPSTINALLAFIRSFTLSVPTGHINSFSHNCLPSFILVTVWVDQQPINLVTAFEKPISPKEGGYVVPSVTSLLQEFVKVKSVFNIEPQVYSYLCTVGIDENETSEVGLSELSKSTTFDNMLNRIQTSIDNELRPEEARKSQ